jgi:hypothetical protein
MMAKRLVKPRTKHPTQPLIACDELRGLQQRYSEAIRDKADGICRGCWEEIDELWETIGNSLHRLAEMIGRPDAGTAILH